jgi:hypothetical protein
MTIEMTYFHSPRKRDYCIFIQEVIGLWHDLANESQPWYFVLSSRSLANIMKVGGWFVTCDLIASYGVEILIMVDYDQLWMNLN